MSKKPLHVYVVLRHSVEDGRQERILGVYASQAIANRAAFKARLNEVKNYHYGQYISVLKFSVKGASLEDFYGLTILDRYL